MRRSRLLVMCFSLICCTGASAADQDMHGRQGHGQDGLLQAQTQVRVEYAPAVGHDDAKVAETQRPVRKSMLVDGTEITHLEGRGIERLRLRDDGDGNRGMVCEAEPESREDRRPREVIDFRARVIARSGEHTDAH